MRKRSMKRWPGLVLQAAFSFCVAASAQGNNPMVTANVDNLANEPQHRPIATYTQIPLSPAPEDFDKAEIVPGSLLSMDTYDVPELSGVSLRVDPEGNVSVPTLGTVHVAGLTVPEVQDAIAKSLKEGEILVAPHVRITVVQYSAGYITVLGEVQNPGRYQVIAKRSLGDALGFAGGETLAAGDDIEIGRAATTGTPAIQHVHHLQHDGSTDLRNVFVNPGDVVTVRRAGVVYVMGAVNRPGGYLMVNEGRLDIYQALSLAGGTALDAARNGMYIIRPHEEVYETIKVPFASLAKQHQSEVQLKLNDVLYVPRSNWKVTLLDGSSIIGAAVNAAIYTAH